MIFRTQLIVKIQTTEMVSPGVSNVRYRSSKVNVKEATGLSHVFITPFAGYDVPRTHAVRHSLTVGRAEVEQPLEMVSVSTMLKGTSNWRLESVVTS